MREHDLKTWPRSIEAFETSDREIHRSRSAAEWHQQRLDGCTTANRMLDDGASVGASLRAGGLLPDGVYPELDEVFASTKLVISHWQCRDQSGYQPTRITSDGGVYVFGDAGSWSGPYGAVCSPQDLVRYFVDTKKRLEPKP